MIWTVVILVCFRTFGDIDYLKHRSARRLVLEYSVKHKVDEPRDFLDNRRYRTFAMRSWYRNRSRNGC